MRHSLIGGVLLLTTVGPAVTAPRLPGQGAQTDQKAPAFEVASIKPNTSGDSGFGISGPRPSEFTTKNAPLDRIIAYAFGVQMSS